MMVFCRVMLGKVISPIAAAAFPIDNKLSLADAVTDPIKAHVHGFGLLLFYTIVGNAGGSGVVGYHWCWWLWVAKFLESDAFGDGFLAVMEQAAEFSFGSTG